MLFLFGNKSGKETILYILDFIVFTIIFLLASYYLVNTWLGNKTMLIFLLLIIYSTSIIRWSYERRPYIILKKNNFILFPYEKDEEIKHNMYFYHIPELVDFKVEDDRLYLKVKGISSLQHLSIDELQSIDTENFDYENQKEVNIDLSILSKEDKNLFIKKLKDIIKKEDAE